MGNSLPLAGQSFRVFSCDRDARKHAQLYSTKKHTAKIASSIGYPIRGESEVHTINLIVKANVDGSLDAIIAALNCLPQDKVILRYLMTGVGEITESDIDL